MPIGRNLTEYALEIAHDNKKSHEQIDGFTIVDLPNIRVSRPATLWHFKRLLKRAALENDGIYDGILFFDYIKLQINQKYYYLNVMDAASTSFRFKIVQLDKKAPVFTQAVYQTC